MAPTLQWSRTNRPCGSKGWRASCYHGLQGWAGSIWSPLRGRASRGPVSSRRMDSESSSASSSLSWDWPVVPPAPVFQAVCIRPRSFHTASLQRQLDAPPSLFSYVLESSFCGVLVSTREGSRILLFLDPPHWLALAPAPGRIRVFAFFFSCPTKVPLATCPILPPNRTISTLGSCSAPQVWSTEPSVTCVPLMSKPSFSFVLFRALSKGVSREPLKILSLWRVAPGSTAIGLFRVCPGFQGTMRVGSTQDGFRAESLYSAHAYRLRRVHLPQFLKLLGMTPVVTWRQTIS